ncbi:beta-ketoacyl-[acyl-carrier-protein] synthase family protein [Streptomyces sp. NPDC059525]|uniref:beta-ketoacyl-[acyl-carrier-protein] synthase family protein n=1 Tax=Streptomyces sp. NPDC059525 TaxID=3346857 RepID=UPI0036951017
MDVFITGLGAISCLGDGPEAFWKGLHAGRSGPTPVESLTGQVRAPLAYQVPPATDASAHAEDDATRGRVSRFALHAARQAVVDAGLTGEEVAGMAVVIATAIGVCEEREDAFRAGVPDDAVWTPSFSVASAVGDALGSFGANISVSNACAASGYALSVAMDLVRRGEAETVLVGGAEGSAGVPIAAFDRLGAIDPDGCRPFEADRKGTVFGEGAAMLVVQSARAAAGRRTYGRLSGTAWSCDAYHTTAPDPGRRQLVRAAREALRDAGCGPEAIGCVIPHGTGTQPNDLLESETLRDVLGQRCDSTPLFSLKAFIGHTAGAAAAFSAVCGALVLRHGQVPPNIALARQDPACEVWLPQDGPTPLPRPGVLINSYAFGGSNVSLVLDGGLP